MISRRFFVSAHPIELGTPTKHPKADREWQSNYLPTYIAAVPAPFISELQYRQTCGTISPLEKYIAACAPPVCVKSAKRLVPIHHALVDFGLLRYVDQLRRQGIERLFPELKSGRDGLAGTAPKWFGRYKKRCGIHEKHTKVFHSFRHSFISALLNDEVPEIAVAPIVGHEGKLITSKIYWNVKDPIKRKPTVEKFQLPDEVLRLIPKFEDVINCQLA